MKFELQGRVRGPAPPGRSPGPFEISPVPRLHTNEEFIEELYSELPIDDVEAMFDWVFASLRDEVRVLPTENYYYFSFYARGLCFWGNLRIGVEDRKLGNINFVYWEFLDDPTGPGEGRTWSRSFGSEDGVIIRRRSRLLYDVEYKGRRVRFQLNPCVRARHGRHLLEKNEVLVGNTFDESGYRFHLAYSKEHEVFLWLLDETGLPGELEILAKDVWLDRLAGYVFLSDGERREKRRLVLVGVRSANVRRNNYWDGPFDQLPDNHVHRDLREFIEAAYPHARGRIDRRGVFTDDAGRRVAIAPYIEYELVDDVLERLSSASSTAPGGAARLVRSLQRDGF